MLTHQTITADRAAHAIALGVALVTTNEMDFNDIAGGANENWAPQPPGVA